MRLERVYTYQPCCISISKSSAFCGTGKIQTPISVAFFTPEQRVLLETFARKYNFAKSHRLQWAAKRTFDYIAASTGLILAVPVITIAGALIKLESKGPVIFKQRRLGKMGREFTIYKLRTMYNGSPQNLHVSRDGNSHITKMGSFLRKYAIDELPQFINILKGDMSIIGPRPLPKNEIKNLMDFDVNSIRRLVVLPGFKINYSEIKMYDGKTRIPDEKAYLDNWSLGLDFRTLVKIISLFGKTY